MFTLVKLNANEYEKVNSKVFWGTIEGDKRLCLSFLIGDEPLREGHTPPFASTKEIKGTNKIAFVNESILDANPNAEGIILKSSNFNNMLEAIEFSKKYPNVRIKGGYLLNHLEIKQGLVDISQMEKQLSCNIKTKKGFIFKDPITSMVNFMEVTDIEKFTPSSFESNDDLSFGLKKMAKKKPSVGQPAFKKGTKILYGEESNKGTVLEVVKGEDGKIASLKIEWEDQLRVDLPLEVKPEDVKKPVKEKKITVKKESDDTKPKNTAPRKRSTLFSGGNVEL